MLATLADVSGKLVMIHTLQFTVVLVRDTSLIIITVAHTQQ